MKQTLSSRISKLRDEQGMTRAQLARAVGVTFGAVFNWEEHDRLPRADALAKLAEVLGVTLPYLLTGVEAPPAEQRDTSPKTIRDLLKQAQKQFAAVMGLPPERVRVTVEEIIGPVGGKVGRSDSTG